MVMAIRGATLEEALHARTAESRELVERLEGDAIRCVACGHRCRIQAGHAGVCRIRYNEGGKLMVPRGYVAGLAVDPIEKKPFFHAYPGANALSFGMLGCDYKCGYCQNWVTSQSLRDPVAGAEPRDIEPGEIIRLAKKHDARVLTSTYNEPLITSEWAVEIFRLGKAEGIACAYVSNGNGTPEVIDYIAPWVDLYKIDLKAFDEASYRKLGGRLGAVLDTIREIHARGIWLEVLTLVVPGFNSSDEELTKIAEFVASVDPRIPWHVTAFHQDYRMTENDDTDAGTLMRAWKIGRSAGLHYVYPGNIPGVFGDLEGTHCPSCAKLVVGRVGFRVTAYRLRDGCCPDCDERIPGRWAEPGGNSGRPRAV
jgi:pyruvate formate lyase activating enzyme